MSPCFGLSSATVVEKRKLFVRKQWYKLFIVRVLPLLYRTEHGPTRACDAEWWRSLFGRVH